MKFTPLLMQQTMAVTDKMNVYIFIYYRKLDFWILLLVCWELNLYEDIKQNQAGQDVFNKR